MQLMRGWRSLQLYSTFTQAIQVCAKGLIPYKMQRSSPSVFPLHPPVQQAVVCTFALSYARLQMLLHVNLSADLLRWKGLRHDAGQGRGERWHCMSSEGLLAIVMAIAWGNRRQSEARQLLADT